MIMFDPIFENLRRATELTIQMQQEMLKKWTALWPNPPSPPGWSEQAQKLQKKWAEIVEETLKRQRDLLETQYSAGLKNIESAFAVAEAKDYGEVRSKTVELWQKTFDNLRQTFEAQLRGYQSAMSKCWELMTKGAA
jgi:hypothetical protein